MSAKEMIDEQTKNENTEDFKHFKMHSRSTLKSMTKDELIDYIYMLYKNWSGTDISYNNVMNYAKELQNNIERLKEENNKVYHYVSYLQEYCDNLEKENKKLIDEVDKYNTNIFRNAI